MDGVPQETVYLLKLELAGFPAPDLYRAAGYALVTGLAGPWRAPVVLKPNVVLRFAPDSGIITHPAFVGGMVEALLAQGLSPAEIIVAEGGGIESDHDMASIYADAGYTAEFARLDIELRDLNRDAYVISVDPSRQVLKNLYISRTIMEAGTLFNVAKMKAHNFATVTLTVKNMQGMLTPIQHRHLCTHYPRHDGDDGVGLDLRVVDEAPRFYQKLVDLALAMRPAWHVIEGIVARDGTGFNRGKNVPLGLVLAGRNPFAVDHVGAYLMGFASEEVGFLRAAVARGVWSFDASGITVLAWHRGTWIPCPEWMAYRANPPLELIKREDVKYQE